MRRIGLDIGTTSISAVVIEGKKVLYSLTIPNGAQLVAGNNENRLQDADIILNRIIAVKQEFTEKFAPISAIGVTGQMHGILYLDENSNAVSPLYTWQDMSGLLKMDGITYSERLFQITGYRLPGGYGLLTHFANLKLNRVPKTAVQLCNIQDYITMKLAGIKRPITHISNAAALGLYSISKYDFDNEALKKAGISREMLPIVTADNEIVGFDPENIPITVALGDNQAGFLGAVTDENSVLVNIGTGSQVSVLSDKTESFDEIELRPFSKDKNLLVCAPLCGGRAYALLHGFFAEVLKAFGTECDDIYKVMNAMAENALEGHTLSVDTRFCGTAADIGISGSVKNISDKNFTPQELSCGFLYGIAEELYGYYEKIKRFSDKRCSLLVVSGNGARKNAVMRKILADVFNMPITIPSSSEEAAYGAALFSVACTNKD